MLGAPQSLSIPAVLLSEPITAQHIGRLTGPRNTPAGSIQVVTCAVAVDVVAVDVAVVDMVR
jgi:hypothetical protein